MDVKYFDNSGGNVNSDNFLGNSLFASVLSELEKKELFLEVEYHIWCEDARRGCNMSFKEGLASFFMDPHNRHHLEKLKRRDANRGFVSCVCDNKSDMQVQVPQLRLAYRDHWYFMGLERHTDVDETSAILDFNEHYIQRWAELFRVIYDVSICSRGYN